VPLDSDPLNSAGQRQRFVDWPGPNAGGTFESIECGLLTRAEAEIAENPLHRPCGNNAVRMTRGPCEGSLGRALSDFGPGGDQKKGNRARCFKNEKRRFSRAPLSIFQRLLSFYFH